MKTARFYITMLCVAVILCGFVYSITPSSAEAYDNCSELYICSYGTDCVVDACPNPWEFKMYREFYYDYSGPCLYGCSEPIGCVQLCREVIPR